MKLQAGVSDSELSSKRYTASVDISYIIKAISPMVVVTRWNKKQCLRASYELWQSWVVADKCWRVLHTVRSVVATNCKQATRPKCSDNPGG